MIKFRAWHKRLREMSEVYAIDFQSKQIEARWQPSANPHSGMAVVDVIYSGNWGFDEIELMQWTGLQDKRGVDIYAGDLFYLAWSKELWGVIWNSNLARFGVKRINHNKHGEAYVNEFITEEVIGNIWEHPELLEKIK